MPDAQKLSPEMLPVTLKLLPTADPMLGVIRVGLAFNTTVLPVPVKLARLIVCALTTTGSTPT